MRRHKLAVHDQNEITNLLASAEWGILGISKPDFPALIPLNFVYVDQAIYFHGAIAGEKFELTRQNPTCTFVVVDAYSQLPSYFFDPIAACPATQLYRSVLVKGHLSLAESDNEKAAALQALMMKLQPEGGHEPITAESELYQKRLKGVAVMRLTISAITAKFKLGQDQTQAWRGNVLQRLESRGCPIDHKTILAMQNITKTIQNPST